MKRKLIIDCDPGHDDIMAILSALNHPEVFEILGYTTVCGNQLVDKVTNNLCQVLTYLGLHGKVAKGYDAPMILAPEPQPLAHGETGLDGPNLPEAKVIPIGMHAIEFMKEQIELSDTPVTLVALAPLTNLALFLKTYPELKEKIECITLMGGAIDRGNIIAKSEFNIYEDPHAAKIVFESGIPLIMSGVEVCDDCSILFTEIDALKGQGKVSDLCHDILQFFSRYGRERGSDRSPLFDVAPIMHLLHPEIFTSQKYPVYIELEGIHTRGMTVVDQRLYLKEEDKNVEVLLHCDREKFITYFLEDIISLDKKL